MTPKLFFKLVGDNASLAGLLALCLLAITTSVQTGCSGGPDATTVQASPTGPGKGPANGNPAETDPDDDGYGGYGYDGDE